jgi:GTP-binding protein
MTIEKIHFHGSFLTPRDAKKGMLPEFAFVGRSNAGKSSLINLITGNKVAKTSATPGKTQTLNYFKVNDRFYLVDLPGYGYAKAPKQVLMQIDKVIQSYLNEPQYLKCLFILMDSRHPFMPQDEDMIIQCAKNQIPMALVFTKSDKLNQSETHKLKQRISSWIKNVFSEEPNIFFTSAINQKGKQELLNFMSYLLDS